MSVLKITDNNAIETDKEFDALMAHQSEMIKCNSQPEYKRMLEKIV